MSVILQYLIILSAFVSAWLRNVFLKREFMGVMGSKVFELNSVKKVKSLGSSSWDLV